jgi:hypothetical protein
VISSSLSTTSVLSAATNLSSPLTVTDCALPTSTVMANAPLALMAMNDGSVRADSAARAEALSANRAGIRTATTERRMVIPW